jgi:hypothetical protein
VTLGQNRAMSLFEEHLTLGQWLAEKERLALYKYLLRAKRRIYKFDAMSLLNQGNLETSFANGEIAYEFIEGEVRYRARRIGDSEFNNFHRSVRVSKFRVIATSKLVKFFAQAELDVLRNFPIPSSKENRDGGYSTNFYPFYDLNYYSNGRGKIIGLFKKLQAKDDELLEKLLAS